MKVPLLKSLSACHPESEEFLTIDVLCPLVEAYNLDNTGKLMSHNRVLQAAYRGNLIAMLVPAKGFPDLRRPLQLALTVPVCKCRSRKIIFKHAED